MKPFSLISLLLSLGVGSLALQQSLRGTKETPAAAAPANPSSAAAKESEPPSPPTLTVLSAPSRPSPPTLLDSQPSAVPNVTNVVYVDGYPSTTVIYQPTVVVETRHQFGSRTLLDEHRGGGGSFGRTPERMNPLQAPATLQSMPHRAAGSGVQRASAPAVRTGPAVRAGVP